MEYQALDNSSRNDNTNDDDISDDDTSDDDTSDDDISDDGTSDDDRRNREDNSNDDISDDNHNNREDNSNNDINDDSNNNNPDYDDEDYHNDLLIKKLRLYNGFLIRVHKKNNGTIADLKYTRGKDPWNESLLGTLKKWINRKKELDELRLKFVFPTSNDDERLDYTKVFVEGIFSSKIRRISFYQHSLEPYINEVSTAISKNDYLKELNITTNHLKYEETKILLGSINNSLEVLKIARINKEDDDSYNESLSDDVVDCIAKALPKLNIKEFYLNSNELSTKQFVSIMKSMERNKTIQRLSLLGSEIFDHLADRRVEEKDEGCRVKATIEMISRNKTLTQLHLGFAFKMSIHGHLRLKHTIQNKNGTLEEFSCLQYPWQDTFIKDYLEQNRKVNQIKSSKNYNPYCDIITIAKGENFRGVHVHQMIYDNPHLLQPKYRSIDQKADQPSDLKQLGPYEECNANSEWEDSPAVGTQRESKKPRIDTKFHHSTTQNPKCNKSSTKTNTAP